MRRNHEPRQLQAKYLHAVVKHRMPDAISRYEYLVDGVDTLHELPRRDLGHFLLSKQKKKKKRKIAIWRSLRDPPTP